MNAAMPVVLAERISRRFDAGLVLRPVSFAVQPGERVALLGPNGAGKTTLLRLLTSLARPSAGRLRLFGLDPAQAGSQVRARIGVVGHQSLLRPELTAAENLRYYAGLYSLPEPAARVAQLLAQVGLAPRAQERVQHFSRGMQQRLALARALLHDPELLLLDEPDAGLDVRALDLLPAAFSRAERGPARTVIFTTHQVDRALTLARRALVLVAGRLIYDGPSEALDGARLAALYGGTAGGG